MNYIDSNVLLQPILYKEDLVPEVAHCKKLLLKIAQGDKNACTSVLTWDEFVYVIKRHFGHDQAIKHGKLLLSFPNLVFLPVSHSAILLAQSLIEQINIRPRDAIHAAVALNHNIDTIISYDKDFDKISKLKRIEPL